MSTVRWDTPEWHETIGSTNVHALEDPRPGRVIIAHHQSGGLGRRGRSWTSPPHTGLAISAVLPPLPSTVRPENNGWIPLLTGLAVVAGLQAADPVLEAELKWPNDVLVAVPVPVTTEESAIRPLVHARGQSWAKICGILAQVAPTGAVVVGTGLNIDHRVEDLPVPTATSWTLARGIQPPLPQGARQVFLEGYLHALGQHYASLARGEVDLLRADYGQRCLTIGEEVLVHRPGGRRTRGEAAGVDTDGALLVREMAPGGEPGTLHRLHAGDVEHLRSG